MTLQELYEQFTNLVQNDDEKGARAFLLDHFQEFPQDVQENIAFAFFSEAAIETADGITATAQVQQEGLDIMKSLDEVNAILADALAAAEIRESLTNDQQN